MSLNISRKHNFNGYIVVHSDRFWTVLMVCEHAKEYLKLNLSEN